MKKIYIINLILVVCISFTSCSDEFLEKSNPNQFTDKEFYKTADDAVQSVTAIYASLQPASLYGRNVFFVYDFTSDDVQATHKTESEPKQLIEHTFDYTHGRINHVWYGWWNVIAAANISITRIPAIEMDTDLKNRLLGEAKFLRALAYHNLVTYWGGVPLRNDEESMIKANISRSSEEDVYSAIEADLTESIKILPVSYDSDNSGRATVGAAKSLLGKVYLFQKKWDQAEATLKEVVMSNTYSLVADVRDNHAPGKRNNSEDIFQVYYANEGDVDWWRSPSGLKENSLRPVEYGVDGYGGWFNCQPSDELVAAFEPNDPRFNAFIFNENSNFNTGDPEVDFADKIAEYGYAWRKYQRDEAEEYAKTLVDFDVIRYADVLLMLAEAYLENDNIDKAVEYINMIRHRADPTGLILIPRVLNGKAQVKEWLIHERRIELCGEQTRRADLVRWGIADQYLRGFVKGKHELYPIPQSEINSNQEINDNNPNY